MTGLKKVTVFLFCTMVALPLARVAADVPHLINVQGLLTDAADEPLVDGSYSIEFRIYDVETGGAPLWTETRSVATAGGLFTIYLGQSNPLPASVFAGIELWLGLAVEGDDEMTPRQQLAAVPYVFRAISADSAGFAFALAEDAVGSEQIADGSIELADLGQNGASTDQVIKWDGDEWVVADDEVTSSSGDGWTDDGSVVRLINGDDEVGIGTQFTDEKLHVESKGYNIRAFLQLETSHFYNWGECGLRIVTPDNKWHLRMDDYSNNNLPIEGSLALRSQNSGKEVMTWTDAGEVGINDTSPDAELDVNGDLKLTGAFRGTISSDSGSDGAPFPRPAYNSGWIHLDAGEYMILEHNVGGSVDDYVVDFQIKSTTTYGITNLTWGGDSYRTLGGDFRSVGLRYRYLSSSSVWVERLPDELNIQYVRLRIWVIK